MGFDYVCRVYHNTDVGNFWIPLDCVLLLDYLVNSHSIDFVLDKVKKMGKEPEIWEVEIAKTSIPDIIVGLTYAIQYDKDPEAKERYRVIIEHFAMVLAGEA